MIQTEADLRRANVRLAWSFADRMTHAQFVQLIDVTVEELRRGAEGASGESQGVSSQSGAC